MASISHRFSTTTSTSWSPPLPNGVPASCTSSFMLLLNTSTETVRLVKDGEPRTATSTFTQRLISVIVHVLHVLVYILTKFAYKRLSGSDGILGYRAQELCESRGGRPGLPSLINLRFLWTKSNTSTNDGIFWTKC